MNPRAREVVVRLAACAHEPDGEPGFVLYDAETLTQVGGGTL